MNCASALRARLAALGLLTAAVCFSQEVTLESLLREMVDRSRIANLPSSNYRSLQVSSYNRDSAPPRGSAGWFADSDGGGFIRREDTDRGPEWVVMEHDGPGCITKMWCPNFYYRLGDRIGPRIRIYLDGSSDPVVEEYFIELLTRGEFAGAPPKRNPLTIPAPFAGYTARAGNLYLPIPFASHCKITMDRKPFYYIINYRAWPADTDVETFTKDGYLAALPVLEKVGAELMAPTEFRGPHAVGFDRSIRAGAGASVDLPTGSHAIRHLEIKLGPTGIPRSLRSTILKMTFDGEETVWAPIGDFFCSGNQLHRLRTWEREVRSDGTMICRWVMPYRETATITVENVGPKTVTVRLQARMESWNWTGQSMHFHANWHTDDPVPGAPFQDWNFIDIRGKGVYVADAWTVLSANEGWWGEGDEKIYIDDDYEVAKYPGHFGTGTEDYYGWAGGVVPTGDDEFSTPFVANVAVGNPENPKGYNICTRSRVLDAIPFRKRLRFDMEASFGVQMRNPWDLLLYSVMTYWYALPGATHNRGPEVDRARLKPMTVGELEAMQEAVQARLSK